MTTESSERHPHQPTKAVIRWLLDSDPSIRWQVLCHLTGEPDEAVIAAERSRVATEGWGAELLSRQRPDGRWGDDSHAPLWQSTLFTLLYLRFMGLDPKCEQARQAIDRVHDRVTWGPEFGNSPFFEGEVEPCINGHTLALGACFGHPSRRLLDRLLGEQLADGGWNCEAENGSAVSSFHTTICVLEGLLEYENESGPDTAVTDARTRAHEYMLKRRMYRRLSNGKVINTNWTRFSFPTTWHYDILRGLDYFRSADIKPDDRLTEAIELVIKRRHQNGRWPLHTPHDDPVQINMEGGKGSPSRWNTLRALRVLKWHSAQR